MSNGNSFVEKNEKEKKPSFEERKKDIQQFDAKQVKVKENAFWKWIRDMFFSGRTAKEILLDVAENQIVPQMKDNFRNSLVSMIDLKLYPDHQTSSSSSSPSGSFVTNYVSFSDPKKQSKATLEENKKKQAEAIASGYETPAFKQKHKAEEFIKSMHTYILKYTTMSVLDLAWMQGRTIDYTWDKYIWEKEEILAIKAPTHINNPDTPWAVILPKPHLMD